MKHKILGIGMVIGVSLIAPITSVSADETANTPFSEVGKALLYRLASGEEPRRLVYTADETAPQKSKSIKPNRSYGYAVCHHPDPIGCNVNRSKSVFSSDYTLLTWKQFVKRRVGVQKPKIIGIIFDPINEKVVIYYTFTK